MTSFDRRHFLKTAAAAALGFGGLYAFLERGRSVPRPGTATGAGFGPLVPDPDGLLDLPEKFGYRVFSRAGEAMDDGFQVPAAHDGMAAFPAENGRTLLVRNHEVNAGAGPEEGAFGAGLETLERLDPGHLYDAGRDGRPALGGTTNLLYDTRAGTLVEHRLSLAGTLRNCAGGPTPWGSWISCEEDVQRSGDRFARDHGYAFEVPATMPPRPRSAVPLRAMGRFYREAVAVHPGTGIVYQTQDRGDGLLYRFVPDEPGALARGGRLQALAVRDRPGLRTQNWDGWPVVRAGRPLDVRWIDLDEVENPDTDLRHRGHEAGAAQFARAEGAWWAEDGFYFACTNGGAARRGQIWKYVPSSREGEPGEEQEPGRIELFLEAGEESVLRRADNLTTAPWGDLVVCEDGTGVDELVGVTPDGELYRLARNANSTGELAGATFAPDGSTLFVNMQREGLTVAITGPWERRERASS